MLNLRGFPFFRAGKALKFLFSGKRFCCLPEKDGNETQMRDFRRVMGESRGLSHEGNLSQRRSHRSPIFTSFESVHPLMSLSGLWGLRPARRGRMRTALPRAEVWSDDPPPLLPFPGVPLR